MAAPNPTLHHQRARVHGRYLVLEPEAANPRPWLVGFHGYAETAEVHLAELRRIPGTPSWRLVAVQALHPFYRRSNGDVVASWMTRLERTQAIADNVAYVRGVLDAVERRQGPPTALVYAGFSQGAAMAWRAAARVGRPCHGVVALGGDLPPDVAEDGGVALPPALLGRGTRDPWYTEDKLAQDRERLAARGFACETLVFEGGHEWSPAFLEAAGALLARILASASPPG
jgi:predicted esterase